jgi:hypothetical protein
METNPIHNGWSAKIWICRSPYYAEGKTKEEAVANLKEHLKNIIPIYENDIWVAQERIKGIKEILNG